MNSLKKRIQNKEKLVGTIINLNDVSVAKMAGIAGYDFIWIDMEHSNLSIENLLAHIIAIKAGGTAVIVRVPQDDLTYTKKILEMGVDGIIFPMVRSAAQANELIANTLYPPHGTRGFGPINAINYGLDDIMQYVGNTVDELCRFIQIEHVDAVNNLEEIIKNPYIDGYIFGPNDLSGSINEICDVYAPATTELIKKSISVLRNAGKYIGLATGAITEEVFRHWHDMGIDMMTAGADFSFLMDGLVKNRQLLQKIYKEQ